MSTSEYRAALVAGARSLGLPLDDALADAMAAHHGLVVKWAAKMNLTAVLDPVEAAHLHGLDSLLFVPLIPRGATAVDVGSGAGFPGVVVALARPDVSMTLLEPRRKRASFLRVALAELHLDGVAVVEAKLEAGPGVEPPFPAEVILSRATIPPLELIARSAPRVRAGGRVICTEGQGAPPIAALEHAAAAAGLTHAARHAFTLPGGVTRKLDVFLRPQDGG